MTINKAFSLIIILCIYGCSDHEVSALKYYVSNQGNDRNDGKTPATAWRTIHKINSYHFKPSDTILFEAGGIWREKLIIKHSGTKDHPIVYTRYGSGINPRILASEKAGTWYKTDKNNIWRFSSSLKNPWGPSGYEAEIFFLDPDNYIHWGNHREYDQDFTNLTNLYDWTWDNGTFYIYSNSDPNKSFDMIEIPQRLYAIQQSSAQISHIVINGIDLFFAKAAGYYSGYPAVRGATNISIKNCRIGYIAHKGAKRGYGIVAFQSNFLVDSCFFSDCGRRAISFNLYRKPTLGNERIIRNIVIRNSIFKRGYHTTSLDFASTGNKNGNYHGDTLTHIFFYNNYVDDSEIEMKDKDKSSNGLFFQEGGSYMNDIYIFNNVFVKSTARNILIEGCDTVFIWNNTIVSHNPNIFFRSVYANVSFNYTRHVDYRNNILYSNWPNNGLDNWGILMEHDPSVYINCDYNQYFQEYQDPRHNGFSGGKYGYYTLDQWDVYRYRNPQLDRNSPTPGNPVFVKIYQDFHLQQISPAVNHGIAVRHIFKDPENKKVIIGSFDIEGNPRPVNSPSIGAYEFYSKQ